MEISNRKKVHEKYHKKTTVQYKIISEKNFTYRIILSVINKYLKDKKMILDIGCGAGTLSFYMASKGNKVLGIDISQNAINACEKSSERLDFHRNTSFRLMDFPNEIPNKKFDLILCSEVLEHLKDDELALKKIFSLLKENGVAILSTPSKNAPLYKLGLADAFDRRAGHLRRYSLDQLVRKCEDVGFKIIKTRKTEGILRNFLFLNPIAGKFVRFIKFFISDIATFLDQFSLYLFGESQIFVVLQKP